MTVTDPTLTPGPGEVRAAVAAGMGLAKPAPLGADGRFYSVAVPAGATHKVIDLEEHLDKYADRPRRKTGVQVTHSPDAFAAYVNKHQLPGTEVWADVNRTRVTAVINSDLGNTGDGIEDYAGWGDHRAVYALEPTPAWATWLEHDGQFLTQVAFAEKVEDRLIDFVDPAGGVMLEIAQTFLAARSGKFESSKRLKTGETTLEYRETLDATAGDKKDLAIPDTFTLGIKPFEGSEGYRITARLRFRIRPEGLALGYKLDRPEDVTRVAFDDVVDAITADLTMPVWQGEPR